jgi:hypothetical protein
MASSVYSLLATRLQIDAFTDAVFKLLTKLVKGCARRIQSIVY